MGRRSDPIADLIWHPKRRGGSDCHTGAMAGAVTPIRQQTEFGVSEYVDGAPALGALAGSVVRSTGYAEHFPEVVTRREVPRGTVSLMLGFADDLCVDMPDGTTHSATGFLAGVHDRPAIVHTVGDSAAVQLELSPTAARQLFGVPMAELTNQLVALEDVAGPATASLLDRLHETPVWSDRLELAHRFVADRLADADPTPHEVERAYRCLVTSGGTMSVADLADEVGWTRRHLSGQFAEHVGVSPKAFARLVRFNRAVCLLSAGVGHPLVHVAVATGYYDQAHFNREFRELAGCTPTEFVRAILPGDVGVLFAGGDGPESYRPAPGVA